MGEATPQKEFILACLPFTANGKGMGMGIEEIIAGFIKRNPHVEIEFHDAPFTPVLSIGLDSISEETWQKTTILMTLTVLPPNLSVIRNLKLIHLASAGANHIFDTDIWKNTSIPITNGSGEHAPQIAEWVIMQILTNSHKNKLMLGWQKEHKWARHQELGVLRDCVKQRLGVLGYGAIGRQTARICQAMGMDVIACTASPRTTPESKKDTGYIVPGTGDPDGTIPSAWYSGLTKPSLHNFLSQSIDILLISLPLTPETKYMLGAEEFAILGRNNTFIINIARGQVLVQEELIKALKLGMEEGGLRGAALDVTDPEPLNKESELWDLENVAVTPHASALSASLAERVFEIVEINVGRFKGGGKLINFVDRRKGY